MNFAQLYSRPQEVGSSDAVFQDVKVTLLKGNPGFESVFLHEPVEASARNGAPTRTQRRDDRRIGSRLEVLPQRERFVLSQRMERRVCVLNAEFCSLFQ